MYELSRLDQDQPVPAEPLPEVRPGQPDATLRPADTLQRDTPSSDDALLAVRQAVAEAGTEQRHLDASHSINKQIAADSRSTTNVPAAKFAEAHAPAVPRQVGEIATKPLPSPTGETDTRQVVAKSYEAASARPAPADDGETAVEDAGGATEPPALDSRVAGNTVAKESSTGVAAEGGTRSEPPKEHAQWGEHVRHGNHRELTDLEKLQGVQKQLSDEWQRETGVYILRESGTSPEEPEVEPERFRDAVLRTVLRQDHRTPEQQVAASIDDLRFRLEQLRQAKADARANGQGDKGSKD
jgi:hypothetical protein